MTIQMTEGARSQHHSLRRDGVTLIAAYHFCLALLFLFGTVVIAVPMLITGVVGLVADPGAFVGTFILGIIAFALMSFCLLNLIVGYGLWRQRSWGRVAAIAIALVILLAVPIGTIIGGVTLWYLLKPEVVAGFE